MHITAKVDYAVRTLVELAAVGPDPAKAEFLAKSQVIPHKFLEAVLSDLRRGGLVNSRRGPDGGYWLARSADEITIADVIRAVEGPLASIRGQRPEDVDYGGRQRHSKRCGSQCASTFAPCSKTSRSPTSRVVSYPSSFTN